jgi:hypothetical protein
MSESKLNLLKAKVQIMGYDWLNVARVKLKLKAMRSIFIEDQNSNYGISAKIVEVELNLKVTIVKLRYSSIAINCSRGSRSTLLSDRSS